jgi:hypothetical protein
MYLHTVSLINLGYLAHMPLVDHLNAVFFAIRICHGAKKLLKYA